jgi:hypothetical protein
MALTSEDRAAEKHLNDCGCTGWMVDLKTREVRYLDGDREEKANSLCELLAFYLNGVWDGNVEHEDQGDGNA